jgi:hypothetical protein
LLEELLILLQISLELVNGLLCDLIKFVLFLTDWRDSLSDEFLLYFLGSSLFLLLLLLWLWLVLASGLLRLRLSFLFLVVFDHHLGNFSLFLFDEMEEFFVVFIIGHVFFRRFLLLHSALLIL